MSSRWRQHVESLRCLIKRSHEQKSEKVATGFTYCKEDGTTETIDHEQARFLLCQLLDDEAAPANKIIAWREALDVVHEEDENAKRLVQTALIDLKRLDAANADVAGIVSTTDDPELPVSVCFLLYTTDDRRFVLGQ